MKFWIMLATAALFIAGCASRNTAPVQTVKETNTTKETKTKKVHVPQKAAKNVKLKEVQDDNYSSEYMYPKGKAKKEKVVKVAEVETPTDTTAVATASNTMNREECINMIGQVKFDQYTQMFGNEASSIKRCAMLKSMK